MENKMMMIFAYDVEFFDNTKTSCFANGVVFSESIPLAAKKLYEFFDGAIQKMELTYLDPQDKNTDIYVKEHGEWSI